MDNYLNNRIDILLERVALLEKQVRELAEKLKALEKQKK